MKFMIIYRPVIRAMLIASLLSLFSCSKKNDNTQPTGPVINSFSVDTAWTGKTITIHGSGFSATATDNTVRIGATAVTEVLEASATTLSIKVPAGATSGKVFVKVNGTENASDKDLIIVHQMAWQKALGGTGTEYAEAVAPTPDGGYLVAGYTNSSNGDVTANHGDNDFWVVKVTADRTIAWQKTFGGSGNDRANSIVALANGGCVVAGYTYSNDGDVTGHKGGADYWIVKLDANGGLVWQKTLGGSGDDLATSIVATTDGYVVAGYTSSTDDDVSGNHGSYDYWLVKLNTNGNTVGTQTFGGTSADYAYSITTSSDGGYFVAGRSASNNGDVTDAHGGSDCWLLKLDAFGAILWKKNLGGSGIDIGQSVVATTDGGCLVGATVASNDGDITGNHGGNDFWVVKLNAGGTIIWQKALGGTASDNLFAVAPAIDGGCAVTGYTNSTNGDVTGNHGSIDVWAVRLNATGAMIWQKALGGTTKDMSYSAMAASNNGFIVAGASNSTDGDVSGAHGEYDFWVFKLLD